MNIGEKIRDHRHKLGYSLTEFATMVGISKQNLYKYETGIITNIPLDKLVKISHALDCSPAYLMGWEDSPGVATEPVPLLDADLACLPEDEKTLISDYRKLNTTGKDKALDYLKDLTENERYTSK